MSVYKLIELVGTSSESWEGAARAAVETASKSLRDIRVAEVVGKNEEVGEAHVAEDNQELHDWGLRHPYYRNVRVIHKSSIIFRIDFDLEEQ